MKNTNELEMLGKTLREARENAGLTQKALAELIGISDTAMSKYENGELMPSKDVLINMSTVLDLSINMMTMKFEDPTHNKPIEPLIKE